MSKVQSSFPLDPIFHKLDILDSLPVVGVSYVDVPVRGLKDAGIAVLWSRACLKVTIMWPRLATILGERYSNWVAIVCGGVIY